jgi:hypothetical protein
MTINSLKTAITDWYRLKTQSGTPATPASGYSVIYEEGGSLKMKTSAGTVTTFGAATVKNDYVKVSETQTTGTNGGTFTSGAWRTRTINTEDSDTSGICSIGSNQITLSSGTYTFSISCPAYSVENHIARLYNVTDAAEVAHGQQQYAPAGSTAYNYATIVGSFTIATSKTFEIQHYCASTKATNGFGGASVASLTEVFTVAEFRRIA